ncbi:MAG: 50S ribosomal protein L1 [Chitinophagales bacterium]|nr:50S ribosomal protein L1 [Chitinophagales bacterium]
MPLSSSLPYYNIVKVTKKRQEVNSKVEKNKLYTLSEASSLVKEVTITKFDASVDLHIRLGVDPRKPDQALRGTVTLPHGTGKTKRVLVLCMPEKEAEATAAGADYVGLDEYIDKISSGWTDVDVIVATPNVMAKIGKLGRILGPRGLMPNPKTGTVTQDVGNAVTEVKGGKIAFRVDKYGIVHASIGRVSFTPEKISENASELLHTLARMKPSAAKGIYFKSIYLSGTMGPGIAIDTKTVKGI